VGGAAAKRSRRGQDPTLSASAEGLCVVAALAVVVGGGETVNSVGSVRGKKASSLLRGTHYFCFVLYPELVNMR
jgi:hypothetical protein